MKILAIPATNHTGGLNHQLVAYAARLLQGRATVEVVDLNDYEMPIYSPAREPQAGAGVLGTATASAKFFGAELVGSLGIGTFHNNFDAQAGELVLAEQRAEFAALVHALVVAA